MNNKQKIYFFSEKDVEGNKDMFSLLGGKGANIAEMCSLKLPVPPGFTITTEECVSYLKEKKLSPALKRDIEKNIKKVESVSGKLFGGDDPLLLSVRSGAPVSMPGMMETVLNIGLTQKTIPLLIKKTKNERFVYDSYRRFIMMYSDVVMEKGLRKNKTGQPIRDQMEKLLDQMKKKNGYKNDSAERHTPF